MNIKKVIKTISRLLLVEALLMLIPLITAFLYKESLTEKMAFVWTILILLIINLPLQFIKVDSKKLFASEGFVIVTGTWTLMSFFGGLPLYLSGQFTSLIDSFFEVASGFTTTGASVLADVSVQSPSIIIWKAMQQFIGGMGVLVFALAVLPSVSKEDIHLMKAESPGPIFGKLLSRLKDSARILYTIYALLTSILIVALLLAGMPLFDAVTHAFETAGTGGFSIRNGSVAHYNSAFIEMIIGLGMLAFSINFSLYHLFLIGKAKNFFDNEELKWFIGIVLSAILLITINISSDLGVLKALRHSFFTVSSTISTTGFSSTDYTSWPLFSQIIIMALMFIGGMAGSTAGGLKVIRVSMASKYALMEVKKQRNPKRILKMRYDGKVVEDKYLRTLINYFSLYVIIFFVLLLSVSIDLQDFISAFSAVATTFNNVGPGLGQFGPASSFAMLSNFNKVLLSFAMIAGRLEIFPMIILFSPDTWKKV